MSRRLLLLVLSLLFLGLLANSTFASDNTCTPTNVNRPLKLAQVPGEEPEPDLLTLEYEVQDHTFTAGGYSATFKVAVPRLSIRSDLTKFMEARKADLEQVLRDKVDSAGLRFGGWSISSMVPRGDHLDMNGSVTVEKWWRTKWICCKWFECHECDIEGKLFQRTVDFTATVTRKYGLTNVSYFQGGVAGVSRPISPQRAEPAENMDMTANGTTSGSQSDLEKVLDFVTGLGESLADIFGDKPKWQMKDWLKQTFDDSFEGPNPLLLKEQLLSYAHSSDDTDKSPMEQRWFWQSFVSGLDVDHNRSLYGADPTNGRLKFLSAFDLNYDAYTRYLKGFADLGGVSSWTDFLEMSIFCAGGVDEMMQKYVEQVAQQLEGTKQPGVTVQATRGTVQRTLAAHYGVWGLEEYFRSNDALPPKGSAGGEMDLPPAEDIINDVGVTPIGGNLWAMAAEYGWSDDERRCAEKLARKRSGSKSLIYPNQDFSSCLVDEGGLSPIQNKIIDDILVRTDAKTMLVEQTQFGGPIPGGSTYRGWYYCYKNTSMCVGKDRMIWVQEASTFSGRQGTHKAIDVFDTADATDTTTPIQAVVAGQVIYNNLDPTGWGNALIIPFKFNGLDHMAIYAHLPATAKQFDGKTVALGATLGVAGCTGNAGDGNGKCNDYCFAKGSYRTDLHLHLEIVQINADKTKTKLDPAKFLNITIANDGDKRLYACEQNPAAADL